MKRIEADGLGETHLATLKNNLTPAVDAILPKMAANYPVRIKVVGK